MANDYNKFFSTYSNVEPPPYTKTDMSVPLNSPYLDLPLMSYETTNPVSSTPSTKLDFASDISFYTRKAETNNPSEKAVYNSKKKATDSIKSIMKSKGAIVTDVYNTLMNEGFTSAQACGILGNIMQESTFNVTNHTGDGGKSYGLYLFYKEGELPLYLTWKLRNNSKIKGKSEHVILTLFVAERMKNSNFKAIGLKTQTAYNYFNSNDPAKVAEGFNALFEKSDDYKHPENLENRRRYAKEFYEYFNS